MRVLRGRDPRPAVDREHTAALLADASDGTPGVRVWTPPRQVAFGRRDAREPGFGRAKRLAAERVRADRTRRGGEPSRTRATRSRSHTRSRSSTAGVSSRFRTDTSARSRRLSERCGASARRCRPASRRSRSVRAITQSASRVAAKLRGSPSAFGGRRARGGLSVCRHAGGRECRRRCHTAAVYDALGVPFDPETVGSVAEANGPEDPKPVARALEDAFVDGPWGDGEPKIDRIDRSG